MDAGRHGRCGEGGRLRSGHLRCGPQRLRVLRQLASPAHRQSDGGRGTTSRQAHGHPRHRQGDVQDSVIVQKYGGTSVGTAARIRRVSRRIAETVKRGEQVVAVVSAMGHTTDRLIALAQSVNPEPPARELDMLIANGETITAPLVAMCLEAMGVPAISLSGLQADSCEIYTDVDGIFTADPRLVKSARKLTHIGYDEMLELAAVGARVIHPRAVVIGELYGVPIHVRSSFHDGVGTMIVAKVPMEDRQRVRGIAQESNVGKITVVGVADRPGVAAAIFEPLGKAGISVDVIVQNIGRSGRTDLTFSVAESDLKTAEKLVKAAAKTVGATRVASAGGIAKLSIAGTGMLGMPGIAGRMFTSLAVAGINIEMISTSEIRITCLVSRDQVEKGVRTLHKTFDLEKP